MATEFVSTWSIAADISLRLPVVAAATVSVNWGDGTTTGYDATTDISHTYTAPGPARTIAISGGTITLDFSAFDLSAVRTYVRDISACANILKLGVSGGQFKDCSGLTWSATDAPVLTGVLKFDDIFRNTGGTVSNVGSVATWDTSAITTLRGAFFGSSLNPVGINSWNVGAVTDMSGCFYDAINMTQTLNAWNTSACTSFNNMFSGATKMFANGRRPQFRDTSYNSWILSRANHINAIIPNADVSALSAYRADPYGNRYVLNRASEPSTNVASSTSSIVIQTTASAIVEVNTSHAKIN